MLIEKFLLISDREMTVARSGHRHFELRINGVVGGIEAQTAAVLGRKVALEPLVELEPDLALSQIAVDHFVYDASGLLRIPARVLVPADHLNLKEVVAVDVQVL
jgi:hypothetical protein